MTYVGNKKMCFGFKSIFFGIGFYIKMTFNLVSISMLLFMCFDTSGLKEAANGLGGRGLMLWTSYM